MEVRDNSAYYKIDRGEKSWYSELTKNAKTVVDLRLELPTHQEGKVVGQYGWDFANPQQPKTDLLVSDPYRVAQAESERFKRIGAITLALRGGKVA